MKWCSSYMIQTRVMAQLGSHTSTTTRKFRYVPIDPSGSETGRAIDAYVLAVFVPPQVELREHLIRKAVAHHETRMALRAAEIHEPAFGEQANAAISAASRKKVADDLLG